MNVYVETNFVLELALLQEQQESCQQLLNLAEADRINLILPAFSFTEPYETLIRREKNAEIYHKICTKSFLSLDVLYLINNRCVLIKKLLSF